MPSFIDVVNGASADAATIQQVVDALKGTAGKGIPLSPTAVNDAINFALAVKNNEAGASKGFVVYKADGTVLLQVDKNGVIASPDGTAGAAQLATVTGTQTLTNKTLTSSTNSIQPPAVALPIASNVLGADVALNNVANYFDGPSMAQGASGTWFVSGTVSVVDTLGNATMQVKLWDGTTVIASTQLDTGAANRVQTATLSGYLASPAGNLRISVKDTSSTSGAIKFNSSGNSKDSSIYGVRIA